MMMTSRLEHYESKYQSLVSELQGLGFISQGSVVLRKTSCNKPGCKCTGDPPRLHGPYYQWTRKVSGKTVGRQLTEAEAGLYQEWINNRRELQRILGEMEKTSAKAGEILLRQAKSAARK
jgi:hypothetical protein